MRKKSARRKKEADDTEEIAEKTSRGEDISTHFTGGRSAKQRVNVDFPLALLEQIDEECQRLGITRQAWIKMTCDERIRKVRESLLRLGNVGLTRKDSSGIKERRERKIKALQESEKEEDG